MQGHHHHRRGGRGGGFTHFASLPFIRKSHRQAIYQVQDLIEGAITKCTDGRKLRKASQKLMHLTLGMLTLPDNQTKARAVDVFEQLRPQLEKELAYTTLTFAKIGYFTRYNRREGMNEVNVIYLQPEKDKELDKLKNVNDKVIRGMMSAGIVSEKDFGRMHVNYNKNNEKFQINQYHLTLFRLQGGVFENELFLQTMHDLRQMMKPLRIECDFVDISTRFHYDETKFYAPLTRVRLESQM